MNATFRLSRTIRAQGVFFTLIFATASAATLIALLTLDDPTEYGFKRPNDVWPIFWLTAVTGSVMTLIGVYLLAASYIECLTISGTVIRIRSVFQRREFDVSALDSLTWRSTPQGGKLLFRTADRIIRLELHGFSRPDQLQIIRLIRNLVPTDKQLGWPPFCREIALRLRDGVDLSELELIHGKKFTQRWTTRRTYDRPFTLIIPVAIGVSLLAGWLYHSAKVLLIPPTVISFWLLLRYTVPAEGRNVLVAKSSPEERKLIWCISLGFLYMMATQLTLISLVRVGIIEPWFEVILQLVAFLPVIAGAFYLLQRIRAQRKAPMQAKIDAAALRWEQGEAAISTDAGSVGNGAC